MPPEMVREYDVREAALRWAFANNGSDLRPPAAHCVGGPRGRNDDPGADFLNRFTNDAVPVRPASACEFLSFDEDLGERMRHNIVDRATGGFALYFDTGRLAWTGDDSAEIDVQYGQGGTWGTAWRCQASPGQRGAWTISACRKIADR
jgi:hypothetical protein